MADLPPDVIVRIPSTALSTRYGATTPVKLGVIQLVCGFVTTTLSILAIFTASPVSAFGIGIWSGASFIQAGVLGISSRKSRGNRLILSFVVTSLVATGCALLLLGTSIYAANLCKTEVHSYQQVNQVLAIMLLITSIVESICSFLAVTTYFKALQPYLVCRRRGKREIIEPGPHYVEPFTIVPLIEAADNIPGNKIFDGISPESVRLNSGS